MKARTPRNLDLHEQAEAQQRYFYLTLTDITKPITLRRIGKDHILIDAHKEVLSLGLVRGFILAKNDTGIIRFDAKLAKDEGSDEKFDIIRLDVDAGSLALDNNREFCRLPFLEERIPCLLHHDSKKIKAELHNISAGGFSIKTKSKLDLESVWDLSVTIPSYSNKMEEFSVMVVHVFPDEYLEGPENIYGTAFLRRPSEGHAHVINDEKEEAIIKYVNQQLIERRKKKKEEELELGA
ncbi:MAG: PilZ domain-containing protein [Deltaproteobacteria bacterium]|nr:PilZ domain-containing protein [Deltaproteobacteria bacterium]